LLPYIGVLLVAGWIERPRLRMRFFLTYALSWALLGTVGAILTASVGPCFYDDFYGSDRFAPLMNHLAEVDRSLPLMTLVMQDQLLFWAQAGSNGLGRGISAMPSMHISIAFLFALVGWRVSRLWGGFATAFLILIFIGSIQTGYHYAVDAYAAVAGTLALWWVAGRVVSTLYRRRNAPSQQGVPVAVSAAAE
jgi:hypothetical protein